MAPATITKRAPAKGPSGTTASTSSTPNGAKGPAAAGGVPAPAAMTAAEWMVPAAPAAEAPGDADEVLVGVTPEERVAGILVSLGQEVSAEVLKHLPEVDIGRVTLEIFRLRQLPVKVMDRLMRKAHEELVAADYLSAGGMEYAQELLTRALGPSRAAELIDQLFARTVPSPFDFLREADPLQLVNLIQSEHPQMIALILSHLPPEQGAVVLMGLSAEVQRDVAVRVALMDRTAPHVVKEVERLLKKKVSVFATHDFESAGGVKHLVDLLNQTDNKSQKTILMMLEETDPDLAEEIKTSMFTFEDVVDLADSDMIKVVREVDSKDLTVALRGATEVLREKFHKGMSGRAWAQLVEDMELMGPQRLAAIEEAQQKIVQVIRRLEQGERIVIARGKGEELR